MLQSLEGSSKQALGFALRDDGSADGAAGFQFRYHTADDTMGWLAATSGEKRYTAVNVRLDVLPLSREQAIRLVRQRRLQQDSNSLSVETKE